MSDTAEDYKRAQELFSAKKVIASIFLGEHKTTKVAGKTLGILTWIMLLARRVKLF